LSFIETSVRRARMLGKWRRWVREIARVAKELLPGAEVYVVGSVARGDYVAGSDVDVLLVSPAVSRRAVERGRIKALIEERLGLPYYHPFEIHVLTPEEAEPYLRRARRVIKVG